jgi:MoxR-like ATPase
LRSVARASPRECACFATLFAESLRVLMTSPPSPLLAAIADAQTVLRHVEARVLGKPEACRLALLAFLADGHLLLEDVPGVGKTTLARALSSALGGTQKRVQSTSDLLPSDIVGLTVLDPEARSFVFRPGPVFTNVLLVDEINRASPRTQSALLEAMHERSVTVDGVTHALPRPFFVVATQNPGDFVGTSPLPESQLDRFLVRTSLGYPARSTELELVRRGTLDDLPGAPPLSVERVVALQHAAAQVRLEDSVADYLLAIVEASRIHERVSVGVSTRGAMAFARAARAQALLAGRTYATPDDVKAVARPVLAHRLRLAVATQGFAVRREESEGVVDDVLRRVRVPV